MMISPAQATSHASQIPPAASPASPRICITPTRNEAWIAAQFAAAATCWADHVIVADQLSTDDTQSILERFPGVSVIPNDSPKLDECHRQKLLLERARKIPGKRILIGLDADEALSANCVGSPDWNRIAQAAPGTILRFRWINILPGFSRAWASPDYIPLGFVDDGSPHEGKDIHSPRVPNPNGAPVLDLDDIVVLHFQYVLWDRMASKQRWYQLWEYQNKAGKGPLDIYRHYHHMLGSWGEKEILPIRPEWFAGYEERGIDFKSLKSEPVTWWDREIILQLCAHGPNRFRRIAIWEQDWNEVARRAELSAGDLSDPRSFLEKAAHRLLAATQRRRHHIDVRMLEYLLRRCGW